MLKRNGSWYYLQSRNTKSFMMENNTHAERSKFFFIKKKSDDSLNFPVSWRDPRPNIGKNPKINDLSEDQINQEAYFRGNHFQIDDYIKPAVIKEKLLKKSAAKQTGPSEQVPSDVDNPLAASGSEPVENIPPSAGRQHLCFSSQFGKTSKKDDAAKKKATKEQAAKEKMLGKRAAPILEKSKTKKFNIGSGSQTLPSIVIREPADRQTPAVHQHTAPPHKAPATAAPAASMSQSAPASSSAPSESAPAPSTNIPTSPNPQFPLPSKYLQSYSDLTNTRPPDGGLSVFQQMGPDKIYPWLNPKVLNKIPIDSCFKSAGNALDFAFAHAPAKDAELMKTLDPAVSLRGMIAMIPQMLAVSVGAHKAYQTQTQNLQQTALKYKGENEQSLKKLAEADEVKKMLESDLSEAKKKIEELEKMVAEKDTLLAKQNSLVSAAESKALQMEQEKNENEAKVRSLEDENKKVAEQMGYLMENLRKGEEEKRITVEETAENVREQIIREIFSVALRYRSTALFGVQLKHGPLDLSEIDFANLGDPPVSFALLKPTQEQIDEQKDIHGAVLVRPAEAATPAETPSEAGGT